MPTRDGDSTGEELVNMMLTDKEKIMEEGLEIMVARNEELYKDYGQDYVSFWIMERDALDEWSDIQNIQDFEQALANANNPPFDPEGDLDIPDPTGELYDLAVQAAWDCIEKERAKVAIQA